MTNSSTLLENPTNKIGLITCWIITEGMIGTQNQCVGVANALGLNPIIKQIGLRQPWKTFSPWLGFETTSSFSPSLTPPKDSTWPDILITSGRKSVAASRYIKKQSGGKTFTVHIQDPKISATQFDLVAVPFHDKLRGQNVIVTDGAPNKLTKDKLNQAKQDFAPPFESMKSPRVAVLIGGNSRTHKLTNSITHQLINQLSNLDASLMVTTSRRTGEENLKMIQDALTKDQNFIWSGNGQNPYLGMLAWADYIIVTSDSVSMLSDAGTTGKPVYMVNLEGGSPRFNRLYDHLNKIDVTRNFTGNLEAWTYEPLHDAQKVAHAIKENWDKL